jgi:hypothetical protein
MGLALWRRDGVNTPCTVLSAMFQCYRDAFEDFVPGLKAEWKAVFSNKVQKLGGLYICPAPHVSS